MVKVGEDRIHGDGGTQRRNGLVKVAEERINDQGMTKKINVGHCGTNVVGKQE